MPDDSYGGFALGNPPTTGALKPQCATMLMACLKWRFAARNHPTLFALEAP
jgi:hypothetical protein